MVLNTHYMDDAARSGRFVVMDAGKIILDAPPREVFSHVERLKAVGLDVPQSAELVHVLRAEGFSLPDGVITVDECVKALETLLCAAR